MTPAIAALLSFFAYAVAYRYYGGFLTKKVFRLDSSRKTPAHLFQDGVDYVPTPPFVLFGHHFASIAGLGPMLGPAVAVIWGWVPALLWVVVGAIVVGCVHDFSAMVLSARAQGMSIGKVAEGVIGKRARTLFHLIIFFGVALAMGVFVYVLARLFSVELAPGHAGYPQAVPPSVLLMVLAGICGFLVYRRKWKWFPLATAAFLMELVSIWWYRDFGPPQWWPTPFTWSVILLTYAFLAAVLPVWILLQPRDFLNSLLLYLGIGLAFVGMFVGNPQFDAPAVSFSPDGAPPIFPFVFIVIACGAASGFHALVSSGTTAKQLDKEPHAQPIGYGAMIGESMLALLATLACSAGFASNTEWHHHYHSWNAAQGLTQNIDAFIAGTSSFVIYLGLPAATASALIATVVVSFALTTLDSATRLLRFNIEEIAASAGIQRLNRSISAAFACGAIAVFAFYDVGGKPAALALWRLFGTTNQLLAGLTLVLVTAYLRQRRWPTWPAAIPAVFMMTSTLVAMVGNLWQFAFGQQADLLLFAVGIILFILGCWLVVETVLTLRNPTIQQSVTIEFSDKSSPASASESL